MSSYALRDGVALIVLDHPPVNALSHALRLQLFQAIAAAEADAAVSAIVLSGQGKAFCAGADVGELGTPQQMAEPVLPQLLERIDDCAKPIVAAINGVALGGGLELAMCCHARVARDSASVGLPEITLGLIPGSGGTQRLPRLVGPSKALTMMLGGQLQPAVRLAESGLFTRVVSSDEVDQACSVALSLASAASPPVRARDRRLDADAVQAAVEAERLRLNARQRLQPAYDALLDAVMACALGFDDGLKRERKSFLELVASPAAQALRYQFKAEREATKLPAGLRSDPIAVDRIAVIGAGTMGTGIAISALDAGLQVTLIEQDETALQRGTDRIGQHYRERVCAGKAKATAAAASQARLRSTLDWSALADVDLVIEAVFEDLAVKQDVFRRIDGLARPGAILASNTSYLNLDAIASATRRPQDVLGLHFFSPANVMKLLEVVRGRDTSPEVLATGMALGQRLKKVTVSCGNAFGFIGNRIYNAYRSQCEFMLEDGAWPEQIDRALVGMGFAMGPFAVADLSGLDIAWRMRKAQAATRDPGVRYVAILDTLCEAGRFGRKTGAGYYTYVDGKPARETDDVVRAAIAQASAARGLQRQPLSPETICRRALLAMVNEAALLMAEGVATRASDIDVVLVQGYGFPRWEGGPVFWARQQQRDALARELADIAATGGRGQSIGDLARLLD